MEYFLPIKKNASILALGAESAGNFSVYNRGKVYFSDDFGDLLEEKSWKSYKEAVSVYLKNNKIKPRIILTDLHPLFNTTLWAQELAQKYRAKHIPVQHHLAHIFSAIGDKIIRDTKCQIPDTIYGIACDGTGYGTDGKIWGGEVFEVSNFQFPCLPAVRQTAGTAISNKASKSKIQISRIGHLENQTLIGGDLAVQEPARMLIGILSKFLSEAEVYKYIKKHYSRNEFKLLYNQLQQNFNCLETSSAGRILDAVSLLLGSCGNERKYKHEPIDLLEKNSTKPYTNLKPKIKEITDPKSQITNYQLLITPIFEYLLKYLSKYPPRDKNSSAEEARHLAATAQLYLAEGLYEIIERQLGRHLPLFKGEMPEEQRGFFAGGIANNKIISDYLISKRVYVSKRIPRGDAGLSFGQVVYYLLSK